MMGSQGNVSRVGLDVHRKFSVAAARDPEGRVVWRRRLGHADREELRREMAAWPRGTQVVLEGTFGWGWVSDELLAAGQDPHLASGRKVAGWRQARGLAKSNRVDADLLGELWEQQKPRWWEVWLVPQEVRDQRELLRHRAAMVKMQTETKNRVHALLHRHGILHEFSDLFGVGGRRFLSLLAGDEVRLREAGRQTLKDQLALLEALRRVIARLTRQFRAALRRCPAGARLMTLPGVSAVPAYTIVAEVGWIERFEDARHLVSYSLLAPRAADSGEERAGKPIGRRIGNAGRHTLQWAWIEAARNAVRKDPALRALFERRTEGGKRDRNRGYIAVANRMCRVGYAMWKSGADYREDRPERPGGKAVQERGSSRPGTHQPFGPVAAGAAPTAPANACS